MLDLLSVYRHCTVYEVEHNFTKKQIELLAHFMFRAQSRNDDSLSRKIGYEIYQVLAKAFGSG